MRSLLRRSASRRQRIELGGVIHQMLDLLHAELLARGARIAEINGETVDDVIERALRAYVDRPPEVASQPS